LVVEAQLQGAVPIRTENTLPLSAERGLFRARCHSQVNHANKHGNAALCGAAMNGHVKAIDALVVAGAEVNHCDCKGNTALYFAALKGHVDAMQALLEAGADPNRANHAGRTPLAAARAGKHEAAAQVLMKALATA
jgi:ankyrin repeat protein